jgi:hypothetical protein
MNALSALIDVSKFARMSRKIARAKFISKILCAALNTIVAAPYAVNAERKPLEQVATPLSAVT